jgi:hypothetical protein
VDLIEVRMRVGEMFDNVVDSMPEELAELVKTQTYIAGGCFKSLVLDETVNDWDFWFRNVEAKDKFEKLFHNAEYTRSSNLTNRDRLRFSKLTKITENAFNFNFPKEKVQFVTTMVGSPSEVVYKFDFLHAQCYYDPMNKFLSCPTHFIINKELYFNPKTITPLSSLKRAFKFTKQGWNISDDQLENIVKSITGVDWKNPEEVKKQTKGMYKSPRPIMQEPDTVATPRRYDRPVPEPMMAQPSLNLATEGYTLPPTTVSSQILDVANTIAVSNGGTNNDDWDYEWSIDPQSSN